MVTYDAMGNVTGGADPDEGAKKPAVAAPKGPSQEQLRQMQGLLKVNGAYGGGLSGQNDATTKAAVEKFQKANGLDPAKASPEDTLAKLRAATVQNPQALANMNKMVAAGGTDNIRATQYGLGAMGSPIAATGEMNNGVKTALDNLNKVAARNDPVANAATAAATAAAAASKPAAPKIDPDIQKVQGYLRGLGITEVTVNGQKREVAVNGQNDATTSAAIAKYKADNNLGNDVNFAAVTRHMEEKLKTNPPDLQRRLSQTAEQGPGAGFNNIASMQIILNLLAPIISALTGGKINLEKLKVDGTSGPLTTNAYNGYNGGTQMAAAPKPPGPIATAAAPATAAPGITQTSVRPDAPAPETDEQRRDRLGMSQKQYDKLKADQAEWQQKVDNNEPYKKQSPMMVADAGDRAAQRTLGLDDAKWAALKKENQAWQTKVDNDEPVQKPGPLAAAFVAAEVRPNMQQGAITQAFERVSPAPVRPEPRPQPAQIIVPSSEGSAQVYSGGRIYREGPSSMARQSFGNASGIDQLNRTLAERQMYRDAGYSPALAKQMVDMNRREEMIRGGYDPRDAEKQIRQISKMADTQEKGMLKAERQMEAAERRAERQMDAAERRAAREYDRDVRQVSRDAGRIGSILTDRNSRNDHRAIDIAVRNGVGAVLGSGPLSGIFRGQSAGDGYPSSDRAAREWSRDAGRVAGILTDRNDRNDHRANGIIVERGVEAVLRGGIPGIQMGRSAQIYTAPPVTYRTMEDRGFSFSRSNALVEPYNTAGGRGLDAAERRQIFEGAQMQKGTIATMEDRDPNATRTMTTMEDRDPNARRTFDNNFGRPT